VASNGILLWAIYGAKLYVVEVLNFVVLYYTVYLKKNIKW